MREQIIIQSFNYTAVPFATPPAQINYWTELLSFTLLENITALKTAGFTFEQPVDGDFVAMETDFDTYLGTLNTWLDTSVGVASSGVGTIAAVPAIIPIAGGILAKIAGNPLLLFIAKLAINIGLKLLEKKLNPATDMGELSKIMREMFYSTAEAKGLGDIIGELGVIVESDIVTHMEDMVTEFGSMTNKINTVASNINGTRLDLQLIADQLFYISQDSDDISQTLTELIGDVLSYDGIGLTEALMKIGLDKVPLGDYYSIVAKLQQTPTRIILSYGREIDDVTFE